MMGLKTQNLIGDRYRLGESLGKGGFGMVCRATDTLLDRVVAVKMLKLPSGSNEESVQSIRKRFLQEATTAGRIAHPNVVTIYDIGLPQDDHGSVAFIVMEYLEGKNLHQQIRSNGPYDPDVALKRFIPLVLGVGKGHELGIVHKDIKPGNVFVRDPGTVHESFCLLDFGVSRLLHEQKMTTTGLLVGTPHYMAPEYISENSVTPALDVYQLALILVEILTGNPAVPHSETYVECCNRHFYGRLDIPIALMEGPFGDVLKRGLATRPERRFQNATEFAQALLKVDVDSIADEFRETKVLTAVFTDQWVNPFDHTIEGEMRILEGVPEVWVPDENPIGKRGVEDISFDAPVTAEGIAPSTGQLLGNTFSGNTQSGVGEVLRVHDVVPTPTIGGPITGVYRTRSRRILIIAFLLIALVSILGAVAFVATH